ncbi:hypothetical protein D9M72_476170 [compost metagenome]
MDQAHFVGAQLQRAEVLVEEGARFFQVERQFGEVDLRHLALHAQPAEAERRHGARGDDDMQVARTVVEQLLQQPVRGGGFDMLVVVDEQVELAVDLLHGAGQHGHQGFHGLLAAGGIGHDIVGAHADALEGRQ